MACTRPTRQFRPVAVTRRRRPHGIALAELAQPTTDILHGVVNGLYKDQVGTLKRIAERVQGLPEIILQSALQTGQGFTAVTAVETIVTVLFNFQMNTVCMRLIEEKIGRDGDYTTLESYAEELKAIWPRAKAKPRPDGEMADQVVLESVC
jgi:hypothetical protein